MTFITDNAFRSPRDGRNGIDGRDGVSPPQAKDGRDGADGQSFNWAGNFSRRLTYKPNDVVGSDGSSFVCIRESVGHEPTNSRYFQPVALRGQRGPEGRQGNPGQMAPRHLIRELQGEFEELKANTQGTSETLPLIFDAALTVKGQAVFASTDGHCDLADSQSNPGCIGLCASDSVAAGMPGLVNPDGILEMDEWSNVIGSPNLTPGHVYYLATVSGQLTNVAPTNTGFVVVCGRAASATILSIEIDSPVML